MGANGLELFYLGGLSEPTEPPQRALDGPNGLMVTDIETESTLSWSTPRSVFSTRSYFVPRTDARRYSMSPDGRQFLVLKPTSGENTEGNWSPELILVQNWHEEMQRLVPTN